MVERIKTNIKFQKGLNNSEERLYGFVTKVKGSWRGCRGTDTEKKKIVLLDVRLAEKVIPNVLYHCSLIPMRSDGGFVAVSATLIRFEAVIETVYQNNAFMVTVKFGGKTLIYDPSSTERRKTSIKQIAETIRKRVDLENPDQVAEDFINTACMLKQLQKR